VRLVRFLPERWQKLVREALKFGIVGFVNTVVDFIVFNLFLPIGPLKANVVSTVVATTSSYGMNRHWTYKDRLRSAMRREYALFFLFNLAGFLIQSVVLAIVKYGLHFTEDSGGRVALNIGKAAGVGVAMVFRFWAYRTFVFKADVPEITTPAEAAPAETAPVEPVVEPVAAHAAPAQRIPADDEFAQLTGPLEVELTESDEVVLEDELEVELDLAEAELGELEPPQVRPAPAL
jgi:putative flippase GtrA